MAGNKSESASSSEAQREMDALKHDLKELRSDFKSMLDALKREGDGRMTELKDRLRSQARHRMEQVREGYEHAVDYGQRAKERVAMQVEHKPLVSVLAALGIGLVVGRLLMRGK